MFLSGFLQEIVDLLVNGCVNLITTSLKLLFGFLIVLVVPVVILIDLSPSQFVTLNIETHDLLDSASLHCSVEVGLARHTWAAGWQEVSLNIIVEGGLIVGLTNFMVTVHEVEDVLHPANPG